jgi:hypothetical protein
MNSILRYVAHSRGGIMADEQLFDPDLINLPPIEYRATWLLDDNDGTDTDYSADEEITIQAIIPDVQDKGVLGEGIDQPKGDDKTISHGEHVGVG